MKKLEDLLCEFFYRQGDGVIFDGELEVAAEDIKTVIRKLVDETFDKDDAKAYEFWQKIETL